tara:strand:+ start:29 stop:292 length:264 start_codon:yes stop_codon:yes gene_type:complete
MRQRNNNISYTLTIQTPYGVIENKDGLKNINDIALWINTAYFNGFEVVSRAMVSNWIYMPDKSKREFAQRFQIKRTEVSTNSCPISA